MKTDEFQALSAALESLTPHQKRQLVNHLHKIEHVQAVNLLIENRLLTVSSCPHCGHHDFTHWGSASGLQRYRCTDCHATFNALTGTPLARLVRQESWQRIVGGSPARVRPSQPSRPRVMRGSP